jgi:hypothetical protein
MSLNKKQSVSSIPTVSDVTLTPQLRSEVSPKDIDNCIQKIFAKASFVNGKSSLSRNLEAKKTTMDRRKWSVTRPPSKYFSKLVYNM